MSAEPHKKYMHISFESRQQIQIWVEGLHSGEFGVFTKTNLPGAQGMLLAAAASMSHARLLMDSYLAIHQLNMVEGSMVDVLELQKTNQTKGG